MSHRIKGLAFPLPPALTVPDAGRIFYSLGRDASYAAAERGEIPARRVGRRLVSPTHAVLADLGWSDDLIAIALGLTPERTDGDSSQESPTATITVLAQRTGLPDHDTPHPA